MLLHPGKPKDNGVFGGDSDQQQNGFMVENTGLKLNGFGDI